METALIDLKLGDLVNSDRSSTRLGHATCMMCKVKDLQIRRLGGRVRLFDVSLGRYHLCKQIVKNMSPVEAFDQAHWDGVYECKPSGWSCSLCGVYYPTSDPTEVSNGFRCLSCVGEINAMNMEY